eukprot:scaffold421336_cov57-Attheya_sp.AAC.4
MSTVYEVKKKLRTKRLVTVGYYFFITTLVGRIQKHVHEEGSAKAPYEYNHLFNRDRIRRASSQCKRIIEGLKNPTFVMASSQIWAEGRIVGYRAQFLERKVGTYCIEYETHRDFQKRYEKIGRSGSSRIYLESPIRLYGKLLA